MQGRIAQVSIRDVGSSLAQDHLAGDTSVFVANANDFSDFGEDEIEIEGQLYVVADRIDGLEEDDYDELQLTTPLQSDVEAGTVVYLLPKAEEKVATVYSEDDEDDAIEATVPFELQTLLEDGIRDPDQQESVEVEINDDGEWEIVSVGGQTARVGADYITLPENIGSDGEPPAGSPPTTVRPLYATLVARWPAQPNADQVGYDVWLDAPDREPAKLETLYGTTVQIISEADGSPLRKGIEYTVYVHAFDVDGYAPSPGAVGFGAVAGITREELQQQVADELAQAALDAANAQSVAEQATNAASTAQAAAEQALQDALDAANAAAGAQDTASSASSAAAAAQAAADAAQADADAAATAASSANQAALDAAGLAGSKGKVIIQSAAPAAADQLAQNLWIDTTGGTNTPKRWSGSSWVAVTDKAATDAATAAANAASAASTAQTTATNAATAASNAQTTANDKGKLIVQVSAPTGANADPKNLWIDISGTPPKNQPKRYNTATSSWEAVTDKAATDAAAAAVAAANAASTAQTRADDAYTAAVNAATAAGQAQTTANGKNTVWYQGTAPAGTGHKVNDIWFNTSKDNVPAKWSGSAWVEQPLGNAAIGNLDAAKITTGFLDVANRIEAGSMGVDKLDVDVIVAGDVYAQEGYLGTLAADQISSGKVDAVLALVGALEVGANITINPTEGIVIELADGGTITFPADGSPAQITATVVAKALTIEDNLSIRGSGQMQGELSLTNGITKPTVPPSLSARYNSRAIAAFGGETTSVGDTYQNMIEWNNSQFLVGFNYFGLGLRFVNKDKDWSWGYDVGDITNMNKTKHVIYGLCKVGSNIYMLVQDNTRISAGNYFGDFFIYRVNTTGATWVKDAETRIGAGTVFGATTNKPALAEVGGLPSMIWHNASDKKIYLRRFAVNLGSIVGTTSIALLTTSGQYPVLDAHYGPHGSTLSASGNRLYVASKGLASILVFAPSVVPTTSNDPTWARVPTEEFPKAANAQPSGLSFDTNAESDTQDPAVNGVTPPLRNMGNRFQSFSGTNLMYDYGRNITAETIRSSYAWYDGDAGGTGTHRTEAGPENNTYVRQPRAMVNIEAPPAPDIANQDAGNLDKADRIIIYAAAGATPVEQDRLPKGIRSKVYFNSFLTGTPTPSATNEFASAGVTPGVLQSTAQDVLGRLIKLSGDGSGRVGPFAWDSKGRALNNQGAERPGTIIFWTTTPPSDCVVADGRAVPRPKTAGAGGAAGDPNSTTDLYARLWELWGTYYGAGNGSTTFNIPDYRDRLLLGVGTYATSVGSNDGTAYGSRDFQHTHATPNHSHADTFALSKDAQAKPTGSGGGQVLMQSTSLTGGVSSGGAGTSGTQPKTGTNSIPFHGVYVLIKL